MTNNEAIEYIKFYLMDGRWIAGQIPKNFVIDEKWQAGEKAIKALEHSSKIIDALEKLKDETLDAIVKYGIEKSIECAKKILEENT